VSETVGGVAVGVRSRWAALIMGAKIGGIFSKEKFHKMFVSIKDIVLPLRAFLAKVVNFR